MALKVGIIGLPNVGKSKLFNTLTKSKVESQNYPFATINPNIAETKIEDKRLLHLAQKFNSKEIIFNYLRFVDIAGLVSGASKGEGLGNKFLANIRESDALVHVIRCFEDKNITHIHNEINPINDLEIVEIELILADIQNIENILSKNKKKWMLSREKTEVKTVEILESILEFLKKKEAKLIEYEFKNNERELIKQFNFLTLKKSIYLLNIDENSYLENKQNPHEKSIIRYLKEKKYEYIRICAKIENELMDMSEEEKKEFLNELGVERSGLQLLVKKMFEVLNLRTFFTAGEKEARAWEFIQGWKAPRCAGQIHSDFEKGFIRAEVYNYEDFIKYDDEKKLKENGKIRLEGKDYELKDGDIVNFRFSN